MKLLRVISSLDPRHGGPVAGLRAVTPRLHELGWTTEFASVDAPEAGFLHDFPHPVHALGPARSSYQYSPRLLPWLRENAPRFDAVFVHGLWQHHGRAVWSALAGRARPPYFVFPHGMLDPWFKRAYPLKHAKKWIYWNLIEYRVLRDARAVFFTCEEECRLAKQSFRRYRCRERVVAYGTAAPPAEPERQQAAFLAHCPTLTNRPYWLFLGRLHAKKGIDLLLRAYGDMAQRTPALPALAIAGPAAEPGYLRSLQELAQQACPPGSVHWLGMLADERKWGALRGAAAFILPSHQENFGIAVAEALACGTPVLISNKVNIWREIVTDHAGLVEPDDQAGTFRLLERWQALSPLEQKAMATNAHACFQRRFEISGVAQNLVAQLGELLPSS